MHRRNPFRWFPPHGSPEIPGPVLPEDQGIPVLLKDCSFFSHIRDRLDLIPDFLHRYVLQEIASCCDLQSERCLALFPVQKIYAVNGSVSFTYDTCLWYFLQPEHVGKIRQDYCILRYFVNEKMLYDTVAAAVCSSHKMNSHRP